MPEPGSFPAALAGGATIGVAAVLMLGLHGRILGISGIAAGLISPTSTDRFAHALFLTGMLAGGILVGVFLPQALPGAVSDRAWLLITAGLTVGFGTRLGGGCTSGYGVCGMARLSPRSFTATATVTFIFVAMLTVFAVRHVLGGH